MKQNLWGFAIVVILLASPPFKKRYSNFSKSNHVNIVKDSSIIRRPTYQLIKIREQYKLNLRRTIYIDTSNPTASCYYIIERDTTAQVCKTIRLEYLDTIKNELDLFSIEANSSKNNVRNLEDLIGARMALNSKHD